MKNISKNNRYEGQSNLVSPTRDKTPAGAAGRSPPQPSGKHNPAQQAVRRKETAEMTHTDKKYEAYRLGWMRDNEVFLNRSLRNAVAVAIRLNQAITVLSSMGIEPGDTERYPGDHPRHPVAHSGRSRSRHGQGRRGQGCLRRRGRPPQN